MIVTARLEVAAVIRVRARVAATIEVRARASWQDCESEAAGFMGL